MATNKTNLEVGLSFSADTGKARREIIALQNEFNKLATSSGLSSNSFGIGEASKAAAELAANLQSAVNFETGKLNLTQFQKNLQSSGRDLKEYKAIFDSMGAEGKQAFNNLTEAILQAEVPLTKANNLVSQLWYSFKQTAKYQFTSSIYRGLISGIRSAFNYAQDLNESLNNIRIVTGQSTDQMAKFAEQANKAAKALSTTTTDYTNAALIYYRQGLSDEEAQARTDVTMKLANASGVSAETAAEQMTAIWNNFAKGSKNLEYFADVITALGASTASSTSEIAEGLEKFAAIGNTVGLSYEYAASALATVTATTRQSADVVGTAFKTMFARIQDLEVGETLEDGTTLGKYSKALAAVGVNIKDANGELKQMDQILEEMATAWQNISKDQQVALAQTVAGTRQYTQLVALMENWDFMQTNLQTSYNSTGTVQKQQDIYAESWEAARDRVKAAAEDIYKSLIDDEFFISLTNGVEKILVFIENIIEGFGGLKGTLLVLGGLFTQIFQNQIADALRIAKARVEDFVGITQKNAVKTKQEALELQKALYAPKNLEDTIGNSKTSGEAVNSINDQYFKAQQDYIKKLPELNDYQRKIVEYQLDQLNAVRQTVKARDEEILALEETLNKLRQYSNISDQNVEALIKNQSKSNSLSNKKLEDLIKSEDSKETREYIQKLAQDIMNDKTLPEAIQKNAELVYEYAKSTRKNWEEVKTETEKLTQALGEQNKVLNVKDAQKQEQKIRRESNRMEQVAAIEGTFSAIKDQAGGKVSSEIMTANIAKLKEMASAYTSASSKARGYKENFVNLLNSYKEGETTQEQYNDIIKKCEAELKQLADLQEDRLVKSLDKTNSYTERNTESNKDYAESIRQVIKEQNKQTQEQLQAQKNVEQTTSTIWSKLKGMSSDWAGDITKVSSALTSLTGAITAVTNSIKILGDESADFSQKLGAVVSAVSAVSFAVLGLSKLAGVGLVQSLAQGTFAVKLFGHAITATAGKIAFFMGTVALIAVVIIGLIASIKALINWYNKDARAAEKSAENAKKLAEAYNEAKTAAEELKNTINDYNDSIEAMKKLSAGTDEYTEALNKANEAAEDLIEKIPGINWEYNAKTGAIDILDDLEEINKKQTKELLKAELNASVSKINAARLSNVAKLTSMVRADDNKQVGLYQGIGQLFGVGAILGSMKAVLNRVQNDNQREDLEELQKVYEQTGSIEEAIKQTEFTLVETFGGKDAIKNYFDQVIKNQQDALQIQKKIIDSNFSEEEAYKNTEDDLKDLLNTSLATKTQNISQNYKDAQLLGRYGNSYKKYRADAFDNQILAEYADYMGYTAKKNWWNGNVKVLDKNGDEVSITYENAKAILAQQKALEEVKGTIGDTSSLLEATINQLKEFGIERNNAIEFLSSIASNNINLGSFTQDRIEEVLTSSKEALGITEELATQFGYESADALFEAIRNRAKVDKTAFEQIGKGLSDVTVAALNEVAKNESGNFIYNLIDSQILEKTFKDAFIGGGSAGVEYLKQLLLQTDDPIGLLKALEDTDWRTADIDELYKTLKNLGYDIDYSVFEQFAQKLKDSAQEAYLLTASLEDLIKSYKELKDLLSKVSYGSVISDEDYQKLIKSRDDLRDKFIYTVDGWVYIGNTDDLSSSKNLDISELRKRNQQGQTDVQSSNLYNFSESRKSDLGYFNAAARFTEAVDEDTGGNFGFNKTAAAMVQDEFGNSLNSEALKNALNNYFNTADEAAQESARKIVKAYVNALIQLQDLGDKFSDESTFTLALKEQYKTVDELNAHWDDVIEDFGEYANEYKHLAYETVLTNELLEKGIDVKDYEAYYSYLQKINPELEKNITVSRQLALTNLTVQKGLENLNSNFESYIEGLIEAVGSAVHEQALDSIRQDLANILSVQVEDLWNVNEAFIAAHKDLIQSASEGNEEALMALEIFAAGTIQELTNEEIIALQELQKTIANTPIGAVIDISTDLSNIDPRILDLLGLENYGGTYYNQGKWPQRANLQTLQNKAAEKNKKSSKSIKYLEDEIDRYHYIRKLLADIERELDRVDKAKERAYGAQHLKYIEQETEYLREQVGLQDKYISEIEGYLAKDRGLIAAYGAKFDAAGNISNYNELFAANFNKYANAEDSTNWENFKKALSQYEETLDLWFEQTEEKAELLRQILDKQLEGIQYKVDVKIALNDRELALLEHQLNRLDDAAYDTAEALANIGEQFALNEQKIETTTQGIIDTLNTIPGITQSQIDAYLAGDGNALAGLHIEQGQIDLLEQYSDQLLELSDTLKQLHDDALQKVSEAFDAWGEKIEDHVAKFQHLNTLIDNYQEIIGLLGRSNIGISNEFMRQMRNQQITNLQSILNTRTQTKDVLTSQLVDARKRASEAATEAEREDWNKVADDIEQRLKEATESWQQAWIDALQANKEAFEQTMQELVDSFDDYADDLKRYDTAEDRYLETYRQAYELSKLTRDIENSINDQDSIRAKKELQKLEDKIAAIKESGRAISENELELLQKEYELRLAEIALEDAQNAKSIVRLNRDNEGNWGYVYTADQDKINEAQQNYEDKLYEYMRQADTMAEEASRSILTLNKEMAEALAALDANAEDYEAKAAEITQFYADQIEYFAEQYGISVDAIQNVARESAARYKPEVVDIIDSDNSGLQTNFDETVLAIIGDFEDLEDAINGPEGALPRIREAYTETIAAFEDYREQNAETCRLAGVDVNNMSQEMQNAFENIREKSTEVRDATKDLTEDMKTYLSTTLDSFGDFSRKYAAKIDSINAANTVLANSLITLEKNLNDFSSNATKRLQKLRDDVAATAQALKSIGAGGTGDATIDIPKTKEKEKENFPNLTFAGVGGDGYLFIDSSGNYYTSTNHDGTNAHKYNFYNTPISEKNLEYIKKTKFAEFGYRVGDWLEWFKTLESEELKAEIAKWLKSIGIPVKYATGGYTGEWGDAGKLAVLHEKELVLNKEDTANILDAVSLIRQMTLGASRLSMGLGNLSTGLNNLNINPASMDQHVEIAASFPGVTDRYEIEEAFNNLVNKASQYAFRANSYEPKYI